MEIAHFGPIQHRIASRGFKRRFAGKHFVKNDTDCVNVYSRIVSRCSGDSFGRHIRGSAEPFAGQRKVFSSHHSGDSEIENLDARRTGLSDENDIVRLKIAMNDSVLVSITNRVEDLAGYVDCSLAI